MITATLCQERLTSEGLKWLAAQHRIKVGLAQRLRRETTLDLEWMVKELGVGSRKYLSHLPNKELPISTQPEFNL